MVLPHLSGDERRVSNNHVERAPYILGDILRLGKVVKHEAWVLRPLGVKLNVNCVGARGRGGFDVGMPTPLSVENSKQVPINLLQIDHQRDIRTGARSGGKDSCDS